MKTIQLLKIIFAVLLFVCLAPMPYGYFQLLRFLALAFFGYLAFANYKAGNEKKALIYLGLAILFQPLVKISLGRVLWNVVDVIVGIGLLVSAKTENKA